MFVGLDFSCFGIMNSDWIDTLMYCSAVITRLDAAEVAAEVEHAREVEKQRANEARAKMQEERTAAYKEYVTKEREELKNKVSHGR